jgi:hypothetical protein
MAETKTPAGKVVTAIATLTLDQQDEGGLIKKVEYRDLDNQKCSDLVDGCIYINSAHALNRSVFGATKEEYATKVDNDRTAQYRLCHVVTEQSVYRLAEDLYLKNKLSFVSTAPVDHRTATTTKLRSKFHQGLLRREEDERTAQRRAGKPGHSNASLVTEGF